MLTQLGEVLFGTNWIFIYTNNAASAKQLQLKGCP